MRSFVCSTLLLACPALTFADFSYEQSTRITGGAMAGMMKMASAFSKKAGQPVVATVLIKGNRMARLNSDTGSVIDLDKETITNINFAKKTYSVVTFEQMREMMRQMSEKMKGSKNGDTNIKFKVSAKETGRTQNLAGYNAKEMLLNIDVDSSDPQHGQQGSMNIVSHIWLAPDVPGYAEVREFNKRMAEKLGYLPDDQMAQMRQAMQGMVEVSKEMAKLDGVPVRTVMEIGGTANSSGAPAQQQQPQAQQQQDDSSNQGAIGALARGLGGFGRKKKDQSSDSPSDQSSSGALLESTTDASGFSSGAVDASKFDVPSGFKQVDADRHMR